MATNVEMTYGKEDLSSFVKIIGYIPGMCKFRPMSDLKSS
jgi:hypothetical protein